MGKKRIFSKEDEHKILELYNKGYTCEAISCLYGCHDHNIRSVIKRFKKQGYQIRDRVGSTKKRELESLIESDTFEPNQAIFANIVEKIKTPKMIIDGEKYIDVTQIICNSNEIMAMGKTFAGVRKNGKKKTL